MMQITFTGDAAEVRQEMLELLGLKFESEVEKAWAASRNTNTEQTVDQQVEAAFGETKRGRGRPKKTEVAEQKAEQVEREETLAELQQEVTASVSAPATVTITPEPDVAPEPITVAVIPAGVPVPSNAQDLMTATMDLVKGDSAKKIALVKLLGSYGAKTINTLGAEHYPEFWEKVNAL